MPVRWETCDRQSWTDKTLGIEIGWDMECDFTRGERVPSLCVRWEGVG